MFMVVFTYLIRIQIHFFINRIPDYTNGLSHGKGCCYCTNSKAGDMSKAEEGHAGGNKKTGYVKGDLDFGIRLLIISERSLGNRSVGMTGSLQRLERAIPKQRIR